MSNSSNSNAGEVEVSCDPLHLEVDLSPRSGYRHSREVGFGHVVLDGPGLNPMVHGDLAFALPIGYLMDHVQLIDVLRCRRQTFDDGCCFPVQVSEKAASIVPGVCPAAQLGFVAISQATSNVLDTWPSKSCTPQASKLLEIQLPDAPKPLEQRLPSASTSGTQDWPTSHPQTTPCPGDDFHDPKVRPFIAETSPPPP